MGKPDKMVNASEKPCFYCGEWGLHWCGEEPRSAFDGMTELEQDRNWWKGTANERERKLVAERQHRQQVERHLQDALACAHSGVHQYLPLHEGGTTPEGPVYCLRCGHQTTVKKRDT